jgi:hypothetical protein
VKLFFRLNVAKEKDKFIDVAEDIPVCRRKVQVYSPLSIASG